MLASLVDYEFITQSYEFITLSSIRHPIPRRGAVVAISRPFCHKAIRVASCAAGVMMLFSIVLSI
jgi:hypothetical protein